MVLITPTVIRDPLEARRPHRRIRPPLPRAGAAPQDAEAEVSPAGARRRRICRSCCCRSAATTTRSMPAWPRSTPALRPAPACWLADDAQPIRAAWPIIERWLQAHAARRATTPGRQRRIGDAAHLDEALQACGDADVVVLAPRCAAHARLAVAAGRSASPATPRSPPRRPGATPARARRGRVAARSPPVPDEPARLARACAAMPPRHPELPAAVAHAVLLRGSARAACRRPGHRQLSVPGTRRLVDLSLRLAGLGWRNVLCETAFVARGGEGTAGRRRHRALAVRWPDWHARLARFLLDDPLHGTRIAAGTSCTREIDAGIAASTSVLPHPDTRFAGDADGGDRARHRRGRGHPSTARAPSTTCLARLRAAAGVVAIRVVDNASSDGTWRSCNATPPADRAPALRRQPRQPRLRRSPATRARARLADALGRLRQSRLLRRAGHAGTRWCGTALRARGAGLLGVDLIDEYGVRDPAARRRDPLRGDAARAAAAPPRPVRARIRTPLQRVDAVSGALMLMPRACSNASAASTRTSACTSRTSTCAGARARPATRCWSPTTCACVHVGGVSTRSRPLWVEWQKHRSLWRYFRKFEAPRHGWPLLRGCGRDDLGPLPVAAVRARSAPLSGSG